MFGFGPVAAEPDEAEKTKAAARERMREDRLRLGHLNRSRVSSERARVPSFARPRSDEARLRDGRAVRAGGVRWLVELVRSPPALPNRRDFE